MNAPHIVPRISRRGESLGTENAFVVLAEVNELVRAGPRHRLVLHRPARFSHAGEHPGRCHRRDPRRQARLHAVGRHRRAARSGGARHGTAARPRHRAGGRRRRRRREAVHRLHDRFGHRLRRRRRGDLSGAGLSDLRIADPRQRRGAGAAAPARGARFRLRSARAGDADHAEDEAADPQLAAQPDRRQPETRRSRSDRRHPAHASAGLGLRRRDLFAPALRRRIRLARLAPRHARAHDHLRRRVEDLGDDRLAHRLRRQQDARAGIHALDHQHRVLRLADQPVGGGRSDQRAARGGRSNAPRRFSSGAI